MTVVSLISFSGAPGTTTLAVATAAALTTTSAPEPVLVELASSGGVVAGWYDLPTEPGLTSLALSLGDAASDIMVHAQELPGGLPLVAAPPSGSRIGKLLAARGVSLAAFLRSIPVTVVADCGRVMIDSPQRPILESSTLIGVVVRPNREDFRLAATALAELNTVVDVPLPVGWIMVGQSPWPIDDIIMQYGLPVLATIADDPTGAEAVAGRRRLRRHAPLARSVQSFADDITKHLRVAPVDDPLAYLHDRQISVAGPAPNDTESAEPAADLGLDSHAASIDLTESPPPPPGILAPQPLEPHPFEPTGSPDFHEVHQVHEIHHAQEARPASPAHPTEPTPPVEISRETS